MDPEKKPEVTPQAPAQGAPTEEKKVETKPVEESKASGLDGFTAEQLKALYSRSPQMFQEAGIVSKPEEKKVEEKPAAEKKVEEPKPAQSAAPVLDGTEIKLPDDVQVDRAAVDAYLAHAKEIGLSPKQVQAEIDFQVKSAREALKKQAAAQQSHAQIDAANVARLKADAEFGSKFDENMELARRAAAKFGDPELLERLKTSDPVLVKHFYKLGKADAEDRTRGGAPRSGHENDDAEQAREQNLRQRYNRSPQMFKDAAE